MKMLTPTILISNHGQCFCLNPFHRVAYELVLGSECAVMMWVLAVDRTGRIGSYYFPTPPRYT